MSRINESSFAAAVFAGWPARWGSRGASRIRCWRPVLQTAPYRATRRARSEKAPSLMRCRGSVTGGAADDLLTVEETSHRRARTPFVLHPRVRIGTRRNPVHPSSRTPESSVGRAQISPLLQSVQDPVQRARARSVPVSGECFDHRKPIERAQGSVMQEVQANQTTVEPSVRHSRASLAQWCASGSRPEFTMDIGDSHVREVGTLLYEKHIYETTYIRLLPILSKRGICPVIYSFDIDAQYCGPCVRIHTDAQEGAQICCKWE